MRRGAVAVALALLLGACGGAAGDAEVGQGDDPSSTATSEQTTTTAKRLPAPMPYTPVAGEPVPEAKQRAADVIQAIGTYERGQGTVPAAQARIAALGPPTLAEVAAPLLVPDAQATVEIVYPQLGGLTATEASVMVVARQRLLRGDDETQVTRTIDVRLRLEGGAWTATSIDSLGGEPPATPRPSALGQAVLDHEAIDLPDSARWDIQAGTIDDRVLQLMLDLAATHRYGVVTLANGHPVNVFGSASISNHTRGRAVDIWSVDGQPVVLQREVGGPLHALVSRLLAETPLTEVGSPWDLDPVGRPSFTDTVHQDHLHLGFKR